MNDLENMFKKALGLNESIFSGDKSKSDITADDANVASDGGTEVKKKSGDIYDDWIKLIKTPETLKKHKESGNKIASGLYDFIRIFGESKAFLYKMTSNILSEEMSDGDFVAAKSLIVSFYKGSSDTGKILQKWNSREDRIVEKKIDALIKKLSDDQKSSISKAIKGESEKPKEEPVEDNEESTEKVKPLKTSAKVQEAAKKLNKAFSNIANDPTKAENLMKKIRAQLPNDIKSKIKLKHILSIFQMLTGKKSELIGVNESFDIMLYEDELIEAIIRAI